MTTEQKRKNMKKFQTLTKAEIQVMNILWELDGGGCIHDIIERYDEPKPAYSTVATFLKILYNKEFVGYRKLKGKTFTYYPLITRAEYTRMVMKDVQDSFFGGSGTSMIKFFVEKETLTSQEIDELIELINSK